MRQACAFLTEPSLEKKSRPTDENLSEVVRMVWKNEALPTRNVASNHILPVLKNACNNCGQDGHRIQDCQKKVVKCNYIHFNSGGTPQPYIHPRTGEVFPAREPFIQGEHSILMCEELHRFCSRCQVRGHHLEGHNEWGVRQLANLFKENCHKGLFTSLPFFELLETEQHRLLHYQWTWAMSGQKLPGAYPDASALGLKAQIRHKSEPNSLQANFALKRRQKKDRATTFKGEDEVDEEWDAETQEQ